jgi:hypothetical protein
MEAFMSKKPVSAKAPVIVKQTLPTGVTISMPVKIKRASAQGPAWLKIAGPVKRQLPARAGTTVSQEFQTKTNPDGGVWLKMDWIKLTPNSPEDVIDPIDRDIKKVLAGLKRQLVSD